MILSMKADGSDSLSLPSACSSAMTSVAASSTTAYPLSSSWRRIAVLPAPGVPVRMYLDMVRPSRFDRIEAWGHNDGLMGRATGMLACARIVESGGLDQGGAANAAGKSPHTRPTTGHS